MAVRWIKIGFIGFFWTTLFTFTNWQPDFSVAQRLAREKHQLILLNFSGSDWCIPCIRMKRELFENEGFLAMADSGLVMYNADFPRKRKNELPKMLKEQNDSLAEKFNPQGKFPFTLLLTAEGKIIRTWDGYPSESPEQFTRTVKQLIDANK